MCRILFEKRKKGNKNMHNPITFLSICLSGIIYGVDAGEFVDFSQIAKKVNGETLQPI